MSKGTISHGYSALMAGLALVGLLAVPLSRAEAGDEPIAGRWAVEAGADDGTVRLTIRRAADGTARTISSAVVEVSSLRGLDRSEAGEEGGQVRFRIVRDAGVFECEGRFTGDDGEGRYVFGPDRKLAGELRGAGYKKGLSDEELFALAAHDVGGDYLRALGELGYGRVPVEKLLELAAQDVTPDFVRGFDDAGYKRVDADTLVALRMNGVSAEFAMEMNALGNRRVPLEELIRLRVNGVSPEFTGELKELGYEAVGPDELLAMRVHGVSPDFIRAVRAEGYENVAADQLVEMRIHGVSPDYIRKAKTRVGDSVSIEEMIRMRRAGDDE